MDGYVHSAPVPKLYKAAARIASLVKERGQSIKELIYSDKYKRFNTKGLCALIINTIEHHKILDQLISETKILSDGRLDPWLARVLITELMWGKQKLPSNTNCKPITAVLKHQPTFVHILRTAVKNGSHENIQRKELNVAQTSAMRLSSHPQHQKNEDVNIVDSNDTPRVLAFLLLFSIAMFSLPFAAFYGVNHYLKGFLIDGFANIAWSVVAAVLTVWSIIILYIYKGYKEDSTKNQKKRK